MFVKCKDCRFTHPADSAYQLHSYWRAYKGHECRKNPPISIQVAHLQDEGIIVHGRWPIVNFTDDDFCYSGQESNVEVL